MDKELLRVIIIFVGLLVIAGMIIWGMIKNRRELDKEYYDDKYDDEGVDVVPLGSALDDDPFESVYKKHLHSDDAMEEESYNNNYHDEYTDAFAAPPSRQEPYVSAGHSTTAGATELPELIQFGIVSKDLQGFNGMQLAVAFKSAGLVYGKKQIFESLDEQGEANFSVASIVEPGTFPNSNLDNFYCPGIVFFMQPAYVDDPVAVFDQLISVVHKLAKQLDGVEWDHKRKPLTHEAIQMLREQLF